MITGNLGNVGPAVIKRLKKAYSDVGLIGFDTSFFGSCVSNYERLPETCMDRQYYGDMLEFPEEILDGTNAVIHHNYW